MELVINNQTEVLGGFLEEINNVSLFIIKILFLTILLKSIFFHKETTSGLKDLANSTIGAIRNSGADVERGVANISQVVTVIGDVLSGVENVSEAILAQTLNGNNVSQLTIKY